MKTVGNDDAGFSVDVDTENNAVRIGGWGFWDAEIAGAFDKVVIDACRQVPRNADVSIDMSQLKPMRDEGQRSVGLLLIALHQLTRGRITVITTSHLSKLQLLRIARDSVPKDRVHFT